jgi:PEP-CTERM motif
MALRFGTCAGAAVVPAALVLVLWPATLSAAVVEVNRTVAPGDLQLTRTEADVDGTGRSFTDYLSADAGPVTLSGGDVVSFRLTLEEPYRFFVGPEVGRFGSFSTRIDFAATPVDPGPASVIYNGSATFEGTQNVANAVTGPFFGIAFGSYSIQAYADVSASEFVADRNRPVLFRGISGSFTVPPTVSTTNFHQALLGVGKDVGTPGNEPPPAISVTTVPEPGTLLVAALCASGIAAQRRRRRRRIA